MKKTQSLMNEKEKSYVAMCFNKNINYKPNGIDFNKIFMNEQIYFDIQTNKKEIKMALGKTGKRSKKWQRPTIATESAFMNDRLVLSELFDTNVIIRNVILDDDSKLELEESSLAYIKENFKILSQMRKFFIFLAEFFEICRKEIKKNAIQFFIDNLDQISEPECFFDLITNFSHELSFELDFDNIWKQDNGYLLAEILIKIPFHTQKIIQSFVASNHKYNKIHPRFKKFLLNLAEQEDLIEVKNKFDNQ